MKECWGQFWISFLFLAAKKWEGGINLHDLDQGQAVEGASAHFFTQILLNFSQFSSSFFYSFFNLQDLQLVQAVEGVRPHRREMVVAEIPAQIL